MFCIKAAICIKLFWDRNSEGLPEKQMPFPIKNFVFTLVDELYFEL
jgi:hypothetical protein